MSKLEQTQHAINILFCCESIEIKKPKVVRIMELSLLLTVS